MDHARVRRIVLAAAACLLAGTMALHALRGVREQEGWLRVALSWPLAFAILVRRKRVDESHPPPGWFTVLVGAAGAALCAVGIVFRTRQLEWLGMLSLLYAVLRWTLHGVYAGDLRRAMLVLYWSHPLPSQVFGPAQNLLQWLSVQGAEWLLHGFNVRVWADGFVLRRPGLAIDVPVACSGMRTAVTVFLVALGLGMLRRLPWSGTAFLIGTGLVQALGLNVFRLALMAVLATRLDGLAGVTWLHDRSGLLLVAAVFLLYVDVRLLEGFRTRLEEERRYGDPQPIPSGYPWAIHRLIRQRRVWVPTVLLVVATGLGLYRNRPSHRAAMWMDVARGLRDTREFESALRLAAQLETVVSGDPAWDMERIRMTLIAGRYEEVLGLLARRRTRSPSSRQSETVEEVIVRAHALMALGQTGEAMACVEALPQSIRESDPRVAMVLAELAARGNRPEETARHIVVAAQWAPNVQRIRSLYPFLRQHGEWTAIASSDLPTDYRDPLHLFSVVEAYMHLNRPSDVASLTLKALARWPDDVRLLEPLFFLAMKRRDDPWEEAFARHLIRWARRTDDPDGLAQRLDACFSLLRPDLAWFLLKRIQTLDANHPILGLTAARYGNQWFTFRRHFLDLPAASADDSIDLRPHFALWLRMTSLGALVRTASFAGDEFSRNPVAASLGFLAHSLDEFERRHRHRSLNLPNRYAWALALDLADRLEDACSVWEGILDQFPEEGDRVRGVMSERFEVRGDWMRVYETLRPFAASGRAHPTVLARLARAQLSLGMGLLAAETTRRGLQRFPDSVQMVLASVETLLRLGEAEAAIEVLARHRPLHPDARLHALEAEALERTQRFLEAADFRRVQGLPAKPLRPDALQNLLPPPAELAALWHYLKLPTEQELENHAVALRSLRVDPHISPFLADLHEVWLQSYEQRASVVGSDLARWAAIGRDGGEKALALHQCAILLCRSGRLNEAQEAVRHALAHLPHSPWLWRMLISLSGASEGVLEEARNQCPDDSEIWLAHFVAETQRLLTRATSSDGAEGDVIRRQVAELVQQARFSAQPFARAADYLLRIGRIEAATVLARDASAQARGYLPAHVIALRCALRSDDRAWAAEAVQRCVASAVRPVTALHKIFVGLRVGAFGGDISTDMVEALRQLRQQEPESPVWTQILGYVRYRRGGWEYVDALHLMEEVLDQGVTNCLPYWVGAEAARLLGNPERSVALLRKGLERYPNNLALLNNLAYILATSEAGIEEALRLVPSLIAQAEGRPEVLDTVVRVYFGAGRLEDAESVLSQLEKTVEVGSAPWFRHRVYRAELWLRRGDPARCLRELDGLKAASREASDEDLLEAQRLRTRAQTALGRDSVQR